MRKPIIAVLMTMLLVAACGDDEVTSGAPAGATPDLREFSAMITGTYGTLMVGPIDPTVSPTDTAAAVDLVVTGRITNVHEGRLIDLGCTMPDSAERAAAPGCTIPTIMMTVQVDETHKGALPDGSDGLIYVEYRSPPWTAAAFNAVAPTDRQVVLYLYGESELLPPRFIDGAAGRPEGQPVWQTPPSGVSSPPTGPTGRSRCSTTSSTRVSPWLISCRRTTHRGRSRPTPQPWPTR